MTGYILFMKEKWRQFWLLDKWPEVEGHFSHAFDVWLEQTLASEKEAKIKNPEDELTDLLETVAKIGCFFGAADNSCGDRAKDISEIIAWAKEFQSINAGRVWDGEWEDELRVFFKSKVSPEIDDDFLANF